MSSGASAAPASEQHRLVVHADLRAHRARASARCDRASGVGSRTVASHAGARAPRAASRSSPARSTSRCVQSIVVQRAAVHGHRQAAVRRQLHARAHRLERARDAPHRPAAQARVADEARASSPQPATTPGHQPRRRAAVAAIEVDAPARGARAAPRRAISQSRRRARGTATPSARSTPAVDCTSADCEDAAHARLALGERAEDQRAMRDRLVAGDAQRAGDAERAVSAATPRAPSRGRSSRRGTSRSPASAARAPAPRPTRRSPRARPGTTTAPSGISSGCSASPR